MAPSYNFAIIRFAPDDVRGERLNIGAIILENDRIDVRRLDAWNGLKRSPKRSILSH